MRRLRIIMAVLLSFIMIAGTATVYADIDFSKQVESYTKVANISDDTIVGVDMSYCQKQQEWGKSYFDFDGNAQDTALETFKQAGVNTVQVKIGINPSGNNEYLSQSDALKTLAAAKAQGFRTNAVILFADWVTSKNDQPCPDAWKDDVDASITKYLNDVMDAMESADATPDIITVGNRVNWNFLSQDDSGWKQMGTATKVIRGRLPEVKISLGIEAPDSSDGIQWIQDKINNSWYEIDYDMVGVSVYQDWPDADYIDTMISTFESKNQTAGITGKQLYIADVSSKRVSEKNNADDLIDAQAERIYSVLKSSVSAKNAGGIVYDRADVVDDWEFTSLFDENGRPAYSMAVMGLAQGKDVPTKVVRNPYQYGDETGIKDQEVTIKTVPGMNENTIKGVDASSYWALKEAGVKFYDNDGNEAELMKVLSDNGVNSIRLRVWKDPYNSKTGKTYGGGNNDLEHGLAIAEEASKYGISVMLCLQYSDFWADPAQQHLPKAWVADENDPEKMCDNIYTYTKDVISEFKKIDGIKMDMVQVGNEVTYGFMNILANRDIGESWKTVWPIEAKSKQINEYLKAGVKAVREELPDAQVAMHLETPNVTKYKTIMDTWERDGVDYDVLGSSYYPFWSVAAKANTPERLREVMQLAASYGKKLCVMETAWCKTLDDADGTPNSIGEGRELVYEVGPQGQVDELTDMYEVLMSEPNGMGAYYWEPAWIPVNAGYRYWAENKQASCDYGTGWAAEDSVEYLGPDKYYYKGEPAWGASSWDNCALFDMHGYPLKSLAFYRDAVSGEKIQNTVINIVDAEGNSIAKTFANIPVGKTKTVKLPKVYGFSAPEGTYSVLVKGTVNGNETIDVEYDSVLVAKLSATKLTYNGKVRKPSVTVQYGSEVIADKVTASNENAVIKYSLGRKNVGKYTVTVTGKGDYAGTVKRTFVINPKSTAISKLTKGTKSFTVKWNKRTTQTSGYKIQYSTSSKFTAGTTKTIKIRSNKTTSRTVKNLKKGKKYYVRVATYKGAYTSAWSKAKAITTK